MRQEAKGNEEIQAGILPFCSGGNQPQRTIRGPTRKAQRESTICSQIHQPLKATKAINKESSPKAPILNQHDSTRREPCQPLFSKGWLKANGTHVKTDMPHQPDADKRCPPPKIPRVGGREKFRILGAITTQSGLTLDTCHY